MTVDDCNSEENKTYIYRSISKKIKGLQITNETLNIQLSENRHGTPFSSDFHVFQ